MAVANNSVLAGIDLSSLLPRFFTIRRGMYTMAALAFIVQPWQLLNGASKFLTVLGGYGVFLGPMTGIMFADYFIVRKRKYELTNLYQVQSASIYWFWKGVNLRAFTAWMMGVWITLPGFVQQVRDPTTSLPGWSHMYYISWPLGTLISMGVYWGLCWVWPVEGLGCVDEEDVFRTLGTVIEGTEIAQDSDSGNVVDAEKGKGGVIVSFM